MDEEKASLSSSGGGGGGKKKKGGASSGSHTPTNASPRRAPPQGMSPRNLLSPKKRMNNKKKNQAVEGSSADERSCEEEETQLARGGMATQTRERSQSLDFSALSDFTMRFNSDEDKGKKKEKKKKEKKVPLTSRDSRSTSVWTSSPSLESKKSIASSSSASSTSSTSSKKSSSVRNALTCFIPGSSSKEEAELNDAVKKNDKQKMNALLILAADADDESGSGESKKDKKNREKKNNKGDSASSSTSSSAASSPKRTSAPAVAPLPIRLSGGMSFGGAAAMAALESLEYSNLDGAKQKEAHTEAVPSPPRLTRKNTLSQQMRSTSDRFSYNSGSKRNKGLTAKATTKGRSSAKDRTFGELNLPSSSGLAQKSRRSTDVPRGANNSSSSGSSGDEASDDGRKAGKKDKKKQQQKKNKGGRKDKKDKGLKSSGAKSEAALPTSPRDATATKTAHGFGTQIIVSPRKPPALPGSKQRLSFSGWLNHFNVQPFSGGDGLPKRKYAEDSVESFLEDIQLDEHINELVHVRGIASMERLLKVTVQQFYDMDIPTSDLRVLIEEINKRKNPPPAAPASPAAANNTAAAVTATDAAVASAVDNNDGEEQGHDAQAAAGDEPRRPPDNIGSDVGAEEAKAALEPVTSPVPEAQESVVVVAAAGNEAKATPQKAAEPKKPKKQHQQQQSPRRAKAAADEAAAAAAVAVTALEQRLRDEECRRTQAEADAAEARRALEAEQRRAADLERRLNDALGRLRGLEQAFAQATAAVAAATSPEPSTREKKTKTKTKTKAKTKTKKKKQKEKSEATTTAATTTTPAKAPTATKATNTTPREPVVSSPRSEAEAKGQQDVEAAAVAAAVVVADAAKTTTTTTEAEAEKRPAAEQAAAGQGEEVMVQYHYPLPIRVSSARVNRLSARLSLTKSPRSPGRHLPSNGSLANGSGGGGGNSEGRMRQAEKEAFEQKQNDVRQWIEAATKESFPSADFFLSLRSGVLLCKLLNVISPGIVKEVHLGDMVFYQMENITYFVNGCRKLGVKTVFEPTDLYHGKNLEAVLSCLDALDRWTRRSATYKGPHLVRTTAHSQFIRSLSGKMMLDKDVINAKKDSSGNVSVGTSTSSAP